MNKVIIIGGDHYNALGLARVFGVSGINPYGILTTYGAKKSHLCAYKSRYWNKYWHVIDESEAIQLLMSEFLHEEIKPVLVPSSDGAALAIDNNYNDLSKHFILPGIKGEQGAIAFLMNKSNQALWAMNAGIKMAKTILIDLTKDLGVQIDNIPYPCIIKPVVSTEGMKSDIKKCDSKEILLQTFERLIEKGYQRILIQEFLNKDYEAELWGSILKNSDRIPYLLSKHVREWPPIGGSVSLHEFIDDEVLHHKAQNFLQKIKATGYVGNIDIEIFVIGDELYLNEVNFRNSGDVYACFASNVLYPYYSYLDMIGCDTSQFNFVYKRKSYAMNESTDFRHIFIKKCGIIDWIKTCLNCNNFAYLFIKDMKPVFKRYWYCIKQLYTKKKLA